MVNILAQVPAAAVGFVVGAFTPSIGRKIKSYFVKESTVAKTAVVAEAGKVAADVKSKL